MPDQAKIAYRNQILAGLPPREMGRIEAHLRPSKLVSKQILHEAGEAITEVFFLEHGLASAMAETDGLLKKVEVGLIGFEGMTGITIMLSREAISFNTVIVQTVGAAFRMPAEALHDCLPDTPVLHLRLSRAFEIYVAQVSQTAACNILHTLPQRLARWLLSAHDRALGNELFFTHEFLAIMLGVRRAGVTLVVEFFEAAGVIRTSRGQITILDRAGLEDCACICHRRLQNFANLVSHSPLECPSPTIFKRTA